jgi:hypothetical protein
MATSSDNTEMKKTLHKIADDSFKAKQYEVTLSSDNKDPDDNIARHLMSPHTLSQKQWMISLLIMKRKSIHPME